MTNKRKLYASLIILFVFLIAVSFPFPLFIKDGYIASLCTMGLKIIFIVFAFIYMHKEDLNPVKFNKPKVTHLLFLPFLLAAASNIIYCLIDRSNLVSSINYIYLLKQLPLVIVTVVAEELVFRVVLLGYFEGIYNRITAILIASAIFGSIHLFNINSLASIPYCLIQALYTFGLGLVLSIMYSYGKNFIYIVIFHFLFNFINNELATSLFIYDWNLMFYIVNASIAILLVIYGYFCYRILDKKEDYYAS